jgi:predicted choloylglycine hydrolase
VRRFLPPTEPATVEDWRSYVPAEWRHLLDVSPAPRPQSRSLRLVGIDEDQPGPRWQELFEATWDAYRAWWLGQAGGSRPGRAEAEAALRRHMPELVDTHARLVELAGDDDVAAAMLTLWSPPPFIVACSQVVAPDAESGQPVLLRNYDYDPRLFEATVVRSRFRDRSVLGTGDCLWGLVDGVSEAGLAVSLTFGGRREIGEGFGVPLVIRYLLEVADGLDNAVAILRRLPHQLSYNITVCDATGDAVTVMVAPDRPAHVTRRRAVTNHPELVEWPEHANWVHSVERLELLDGLLADGVAAGELADRMLQPPLLARNWDEGFATLYTAAYRPASGRLEYLWPGFTLPLAHDRPLPEAVDVELGDPEVRP